MDAFVELVISKVTQTVEENETLILGIKDQVEDLLTQLRVLLLYLTKAATEALVGDDDVVKKKIENIATDAEEAIDKYLVERREHRGRGVLIKWGEKLSYYAKVNDAAKEIDSINKRAEKIRVDLAHSLNNPQPPPPAVLQAPVVEEDDDDVVGFGREITAIKYRLIEESKDTIFISVVGMAGWGKNILTKMVLKDGEIRDEYFPRFWVYVTRSMNRRKILMDMIRQFTKQTNDYKNMSEEELAERIKEFLKDEKYLIVMDDVWYEKDFELLKIVFPNNQNGSRVLVTTRDYGVATHADSYGNPHSLQFLKDEESLELLKKKVFGKEAFPEYLESLGRIIAKKCNGLPLAVLAIAGVLEKNNTTAKWKEVAEDPFPLINMQETQSYNELVSLSYNQLPNNTKDCFLYLAAFPIGYEIPVRKLICLWIAEGFIPSSYSSPASNMEAVGKTYLNDLVNRNLLMVVKRRADGEIKTCHLRGTVHWFCKSEAKNRDFFHKIDGARIEGNVNYCSRLYIRSSITDFVGIGSENKLPSSGESIRSLLTFTKLKIPKQHLTAIPKSYPFLKVLDAQSFTFEILPKELYNLYHLRYLAISTHNNIIPKLFTHLWNLQTLVFNTSQTTVDVKAEIWNMPKLRHIQSNASLQLPPPNSQSCKASSPELQTLSTISPKSCTEEIFDKTPNLQKLGIRGNIVAELLESNEGICCLFDNIGKQLHNLQNLKLMHEAFSGEATTLQRPIIPQADRFPSRLRKLTLSKTSFDWKGICVLGSLDELEVLKLEEFSAKGECWELNINVVFKSLQFLRIGRTDLVYWSCEQSSFPALKRLHILHCENLNEVPLSFKDVKSLKIIDLFYTNKQAATSARNIRDQKTKLDFVLSILPPHH